MTRPGADKARGQRLEELIAKQGWQTSHLARVIGIDRKRLYGWKAGEPISSDALERLAVALETTRLFIESGEGPEHYPRGEAPTILLKQLADAVAELEAPEE